MEGQRVQKMPGGTKKALIIAGAAAGLLLAAYLGLCAWVGSRDTIFPNVSVAGVDVSGLTAAQAQEKLEQAMAEHGEEIAVTLRRGGWSAPLTAAELDFSWDFAAQLAQRADRSSFFTQGGWYLARLLGMRREIGVPRSGENPALERLLDQADREAGGGVVQASYEVDGGRLSMTKGVTGVAVQREQARAQVLDAMEGGFYRQLAGRDIGPGGTVELPVAQTPPQEPEFDGIYRELYAQVKDAEMDPETYEITEHTVGVDFDVDALKAAYARAAEGETFSIPLELTQPRETKQSLEAKLFKDLLGEGTTRVTGSSNRKYNVKLSAQACDGIILLPGEEFSYNNTTGSRSADKGYLNAPIYKAGESVDDIGGGICQTSSTIYYAVLHTSLEVVERHDHQFNTGYVTEGMDATVYFGSLDFRFKNNTGYPVKLVTESYDKNGSRYLTVKLYGTNDAGVYAVPKSTVYDVVAPTNKYVADQSVPQGTLVLDKKQNAYTGKSAQTYRYVYDKDGTLLEKQDMGKSKYQMRPNLYRYNPLDGDPSTWPNGVPPKPGAATDPGAGTNPGATTDPGTANPGTATDPGATNPGAATDPGTTGPGTAENPGTVTDPGAAAGPDTPPDPGQTGGGPGPDGSQTQGGEGEPAAA